MSDYQKWVDVMPQPERREGLNWAAASMRVSLLFGGIGIALALLAVPLLDGNRPNSLVSNLAPGIDFTTTGTTNSSTKTYVVRRSVLQPSPNATCIIRPNGAISGECPN